MLRDLCGLAPLSEVVESMTLLADITTNFALDYYHRQLAETFASRSIKRAIDKDC